MKSFSELKNHFTAFRLLGPICQNRPIYVLPWKLRDRLRGEARIRDEIARVVALMMVFEYSHLDWLFVSFVRLLVVRCHQNTKHEIPFKAISWLETLHCFLKLSHIEISKNVWRFFSFCGLLISIKLWKPWPLVSKESFLLLGQEGWQEVLKSYRVAHYAANVKLLRLLILHFLN